MEKECWYFVQQIALNNLIKALAEIPVVRVLIWIMNWHCEHCFGDFIIR